MMNPIKSILFATDLSEKCRPAFEFAASMATRYQATMILLHVTETIPGYVESRLKGLFGEEEFEKIARNHQQSMQEKLIAKKTSDNFIRAALEQFCFKSGIDDASCDYNSREVVIGNGDVANEIIRQSKKYACDIIILGGRKGLLKTTSIGSVIKETLRRSKIPVLVVPPGV
jgi:nucleotide-binding universal stress UspA family protein